MGVFRCLSIGRPFLMWIITLKSIQVCWALIDSHQTVKLCAAFESSFFWTVSHKCKLSTEWGEPGLRKSALGTAAPTLPMPLLTDVSRWSIHRSVSVGSCQGLLWIPEDRISKISFCYKKKQKYNLKQSCMISEASVCNKHNYGLTFAMGMTHFCHLVTSQLRKCQCLLSCVVMLV